MMKIKKSLLPFGVAGAAIVTLGLANPSHALTVLGNELWNPAAPNYDFATGELTNISRNIQQKAVSFTTDNRSWRVNFLDLSLGYENTDSPTIGIRADAGGRPSLNDTELVTFVSPNPAPTGSGSFTNFRFLPSDPNFTLAPNTTYWITASTTAANSNIYNWLVLSNNAAQTTPTSSVGWTNVSYAFSNDGGINWSSSSLRNSFALDADEITPIPFAFTPIPGLIVSGIIGGVRRARNKAKRTVEA